MIAVTSVNTKCNRLLLAMRSVIVIFLVGGHWIGKGLFENTSVVLRLVSGL